jgi:hypothetical protein
MIQCASHPLPRSILTQTVHSNPTSTTLPVSYTNFPRLSHMRKPLSSSHSPSFYTPLAVPTSQPASPGCSVASAYGATFVTVVDINKARVDFATQEGFANTGHILPMGPRPKDSAESLAKAKETAEDILAKNNPEGYDVVLECTGVESCMQTAIHVSIFSPLRTVQPRLTWLPLVC